MDENRTYSVDRLEGEKVILVDDDGHSHTILTSDLPEQVRMGDVVLWQNGAYYLDREETERRRSYVISLHDKLRRRKQ